MRVIIRVLYIYPVRLELELSKLIRKEKSKTPKFTIISWTTVKEDFLLFHKGQIPAIERMIEYRRDECLAHPVMQKFVQLKWSSRAVRNWYFINLLLYVVFLVCFTTHTILSTAGNNRNDELCFFPKPLLWSFAKYLIAIWSFTYWKTK